MPPDSPKGVKKVSLDADEPDDLGSESRLRTPRFDLEPYARANAEDESSQVQSLGTDAHADVARRMWAAFAGRQYAEALCEAELILAAHPRHAVANACARECRLELESELASRLHAPSGIPRVVASPEAITQCELDHRDGFMLSQIDGVSSVGTLLDVCAMDRLEMLGVLDKLVQRGLVVVDET